MSDTKNRRLRDSTAGPTSLISAGCKLTGVLSGTGNFQISGEIEGDCEIDGTISISKSGVWTGMIRARDVIIAGTVDGDIEAEGRVEITDSARISGTISGQAIAVAEGAVVEGVMKTTSNDEPLRFQEKRQEAS